MNPVRLVVFFLTEDNDGWNSHEEDGIFGVDFGGLWFERSGCRLGVCDMFARYEFGGLRGRDSARGVG